MYTAALFTIAKIWKCFPSGSVGKNLQCVCIIIVMYITLQNMTYVLFYMSSVRVVFPPLCSFTKLLSKKAWVPKCFLFFHGFRG